MIFHAKRSCWLTYLLSLWLSAGYVDASCVECYQSTNVINHLLQALNKAFMYMSQDSENMDIDGYFGVALAKGQLNLMDLNNLLVKKNWLLADNILHHASKGKNMRNMAHVSQKLLHTAQRIGLQKINKTLNCENKNEAKENLLRNSPNEEESDMCLSQLMEKTTNNIWGDGHCNTPPECSKILTEGKSWGYSLTHRIIYNLLAKTSGCKDEYPDNELCCQVLDEIRHFEYSGFPESTRDLFLEQVLVCALSGFKQFLHNHWLQSALHWQRQDGCWGKEVEHSVIFSSPENPIRGHKEKNLHKMNFAEREYWTRFRRSTRPFGPANCSTHTTGLSVALLALGARHFSDLNK